MYHKGEVEVLPNRDALTEEEENALYESCGTAVGHDARQAVGEVLPPRLAVLPHSCGYWVIGGPAEVKHLIADLMLALQPLCAEESRPPGFDEVVAVLRRDLLEEKP